MFDILRGKFADDVKTIISLDNRVFFLINVKVKLITLINMAVSAGTHFGLMILALFLFFLALVLVIYSIFKLLTKRNKFLPVMRLLFSVGLGVGGGYIIYYLKSNET